MRNRILSFIIVFLSLSCWVNAQRSFGGFPLVENPSASLRSASNEEWVEMPAFDLSMVRKDSSQLKIGGLQFAHAFKTNITPQNNGTISYTKDGQRVWRVKIRSKEALSINLIFNKFYLNGDSKLFIYDPNLSTILGAYTHANNRADSILATTPIDGDEVIVEYIEETGSDGVVSIGQVNHGFRNFRSLPAFGVSASCNTDVSCSDVPEYSRRCVALMMINGTNLCSGSLINNSLNDGTPYFLTAAHCFTNASDTLSSGYLASTCVYYFNYETPHCLPNVQGTLEMSLSGSSIQAMNSSNDMVLVKLDEMPPLEYNPYFAGWNISSTIDEKVHVVHHPAGDVKKYNRSLATPIPHTFVITETKLNANAHWLVNNWEQGVTEGGSSGSPLFDSKSRIIGALTGGYEPSGCNEKNRDAFYRLNNTWKGRNETRSLYNWLDPAFSNKIAINGLEPYQIPCVRLSNYQNGDALYESEDHSETDFIAGNNQFNIYEYAERFETEGGSLLGCYFIPEKAIYHSKDSIWMKIYSGDQFPEKLLHKQRVRISSTHYNEDSFVDKEIIQLSSRDNYLHFSAPIPVDSSFFVAIEIPQNANKSFGIYTATKSSGKNTAFFKEGEQWKPFSENPVQAQNASLMLNPLMQPLKNTSTQNIPSNAYSLAQVYPNPTSGEVHFTCVEQPTHIELYSTRGERSHLFTPSGNSTTIDLSNLPQGIYIALLVFESHTERVKIIKE